MLEVKPIQTQVGFLEMRNCTYLDEAYDIIAKSYNLVLEQDE